MKVRINTRFRDKHTKVIYERGQTVEFTEERIAEITAKDPTWIEVIEAPKKKPARKPAAKKADK